MYTKKEIIDIFSREVAEDDHEIIESTLLAIRQRQVIAQFDINLKPLFPEQADREVIASILMHTTGDFDAMMSFAQNVGKHDFVDYDKFLTNDKVQDITEWFTGGEYELAAFKKLANFKTSNKGPGEIALSIMAPKFCSVGDKTDPGDFIYKNVVGSLPDPLSEAVFTTYLANGTYTRAQILTLAVNAADVAAVEPYPIKST
jgi:hypothetical protein